MTSRELVFKTMRGETPPRTPVYGWVRFELEKPITEAFGSVENFEDHYRFDLAHIFGGPYAFGKCLESLRKSGEPITPEMLLEVLPEVRVADSVLRPLQAGEKALSPGMMYKHYAPGGMLTMVRGSQPNVEACCLRLYREAKAAGKSVRILAFEEHLDAYAEAEALSIGRLSEPETVSHRLFAILRQMDDENIDVLYSEIMPAEGIGLAIMNRLSCAAGFRTIDADEEA